MKKEEVERLRAWALAGSYDPPDGDAIVAALDEREALLKALRGAVEALHFCEAPSQLCVAAEAAIKRAESPNPTRYSELSERGRRSLAGPFVKGEIERISAEMDLVWSKMTMEERLAEPFVLDRHYRQLCADAAAGVGAFLRWCAA